MSCLSPRTFISFPLHPHIIFYKSLSHQHSSDPIDKNGSLTLANENQHSHVGCSDQPQAPQYLHRIIRFIHNPPTRSSRSEIILYARRLWSRRISNPRRPRAWAGKHEDNKFDKRQNHTAYRSESQKQIEKDSLCANSALDVSMSHPECSCGSFPGVVASFGLLLTWYS